LILISEKVVFPHESLMIIAGSQFWYLMLCYCYQIYKYS